MLTNIFLKRTAYKPFEYPETKDFISLINKTFWIHDEVDFTADTQDFHANLETHEQEAIKRALLAIAQIEVNVKTFWGNLYNHLPKPEFNNLGASYSECHIDGTEVLTQRGWVKFQDVVATDVVATFNSERNVFFQKPKKFISKHYSGPLHYLTAKDQKASLTPGHRLAYYQTSKFDKSLKNLNHLKISDINFNDKNIMIPLSTGIEEDELYYNKYLSDEERLFLAIQADGSLTYWRNKEGEQLLRGKNSNSVVYELTVSKERKINRIERILDNLSEKELVSYSKTRGALKNGIQKWTYTIKLFGDNKEQLKDLKNFNWILDKLNSFDLSNENNPELINWCLGIISELCYWDGTYLHDKKDCKIKYFSTNKFNCEVMQIIGTIGGYKANFAERIDNRKESYKNSYIVSFIKNREITSINLMKNNIELYDGNVYCFEMPSGNLITRLDNKVFWSGNCEVRHAEAYSRLLEVLGYNDEFNNLIEVPAIKARIDYLSSINSKGQYLSEDDNQKQFTKNMILFSILIENVSLFSQFAIILSFTRFRGMMKNVSNIIAWTSVDEQVHAQGGIFIVNQIRKEFPHYFNNEFEQEIIEIIKNSIKKESDILDWIFEKGEIENVSKTNLINFMKYRIDESMAQIGFKPVYNVSDNDYRPMTWFEEEVFAQSNDDFFAKRPVDYTKHDKPFTGQDLF